jgi:hypothetical protein
MTAPERVRTNVASSAMGCNWLLCASRESKDTADADKAESRSRLRDGSQANQVCAVSPRYGLKLGEGRRVGDKSARIGPAPLPAWESHRSEAR